MEDTYYLDLRKGGDGVGVGGWFLGWADRPSLILKSLLDNAVYITKNCSIVATVEEMIWLDG
jgi:hypothetical protein